MWEPLVVRKCLAKKYLCYFKNKNKKKKYYKKKTEGVLV